MSGGFCRIGSRTVAQCADFFRTSQSMFRIVTLNANGIRSAGAKGLFRWLKKTEPDVVCLQEVKAHEADIPDAFKAADFYHAHFHCAQKKGYAGTALYAARKPRSVRCGFGSVEFDGEGRYIEAQFRNVTVISAYFPSGSSGPERQAAKYRFLDEFLPHLAQLRQSGRDVVICGDINIAHREIDLKNWRGNRKNSGFLPEERAWHQASSTIRAGWMCFASSILARSDTPGGALVDRHGRKTSGGALTIRSQRRDLPRVRAGPRSILRSDFRITHR